MAKQINEDDFKKLDDLHYKVENQLIKLIEALQNKNISDNWQKSFRK